MENYEKIIEALKVIHDVCKETRDCEICVLGDSLCTCHITDTDPVNWTIRNKEIVRLME